MWSKYIKIFAQNILNYLILLHFVHKLIFILLVMTHLLNGFGCLFVLNVLFVQYFTHDMSKIEYSLLLNDRTI